MIIKYIESKATADQAPRYAEVLSAYIGEGRQSQHHLLLGFEAAPMIEHGLTLAAYMTSNDDDDDVAAAGRGDKKEGDRARVLARGAVTDGRTLPWEEALADMRRRLKRKLPPGARPVRHVVKSMRSDAALPGDAECNESVRMLQEELGCPEALGMWALHGDTDNLHLHLLIVTVKPDDAAMTRFGNRAGYKDAMQRAIARIDDELGLTPEEGTRYEMRDGKPVRRNQPPGREKRAPPIGAHVLQWERDSGLASFTRMAQERGAPVLRGARSWEEAHRALAAVGMMIRPRAGGGEILAADEHVKLAHVGRDLTWRKLTGGKRLGRYSPPPDDLQVVDYEPRIDDPEQFRRWRERRQRRAELAAATQHRIQALREARDMAITQVRQESDALLSSLASSAPPYVRNQIRERLRGARDEHIAGLRAVFDARVAAVRSLRDDATASIQEPRFDIAGFAAADAVVAGGALAAARPAEPNELPGYRSRYVGRALHYWDIDQYRPSLSVPAFTDHGEVFFVNALDPRHIETVLRQASERFRRVAIAGTPEFVAACRRVAADMRLTIDVGERHLAPSSRPVRNVGWRRLPGDAGEVKTRNAGARPAIDPRRLRSEDPGMEIER
jgi:ferritin-like metal-binding protein YciE